MVGQKVQSEIRYLESWLCPLQDGHPQIPFSRLEYIVSNVDAGALMMKMLTQKVPPIHEPCSSALKGLVEEMLHKEPSKRPSVHKILEMPFLKKYYSKTLEKTINLYDENYNSQ